MKYNYFKLFFWVFNIGRKYFNIFSITILQIKETQSCDFNGSPDLSLHVTHNHVLTARSTSLQIFMRKTHQNVISAWKKSPHQHI